MNLKLVFRIYFGFGAFMTVMMLVAPAAMMESYGMSLTDEIKLFTQFMVVAYTSLLIVTWMLPAWMGDNLSKAGFAYVIIALIPVTMNIYHVATGALEASTAQLVESGVWVVFAGLFYFYSKK
tara:strand:+ start:404 stop:772 length:369 start_codon:yes stop_codon:yes gene_type:complete